MKNKQLLFLFLVNFVIWFIGMGLLPILPLYASQFGATPTVVGLYLAFIYLSIMMSTMMTGWLAEGVGHKRLFIGAGIIGTPALALLGQATALWQVVILTAIAWFSAGVGLALVGIFTGLHANGKNRGKAFGLTWLAYPMAGVLGGMTAGQLVTWQGYPLMFAVLGIVWFGWPVVSLFGIEYKDVSKLEKPAKRTSKLSLRPGRTFYVLLLVSLLSMITIFLSRLGTSLSMQTLNFSAGAVASTAVVGGLITIPITLWIGALSDRLGRKRFLIAGFLSGTVGALILSGATQLWHFWLAMAFLFVAITVNGSVASAYATDLLAPEALSRGLSWLKSMTYVAAIIGFATAGYVIDMVGATNLYFFGATLSIIAAIILSLPACKLETVPRTQPHPDVLRACV